MCIIYGLIFDPMMYSPDEYDDVFGISLINVIEFGG